MPILASNSPFTRPEAQNACTRGLSATFSGRFGPRVSASKLHKAHEISFPPPGPSGSTSRRAPRVEASVSSCLYLSRHLSKLSFWKPTLPGWYLQATARGARCPFCGGACALSSRWQRRRWRRRARRSRSRSRPPSSCGQPQRASLAHPPPRSRSLQRLRQLRKAWIARTWSQLPPNEAATTWRRHHKLMKQAKVTKGSHTASNASSVNHGSYRICGETRRFSHVFISFHSIFQYFKW